MRLAVSDVEHAARADQHGVRPGERAAKRVAFGPVAGTAFNLTAMSYAGEFAITMHIDPVAIADPADLRDCVEAAYQELIDLGTA